mgnify:CR=1 FL=1
MPNSVSLSYRVFHCHNDSEGVPRGGIITVFTDSTASPFYVSPPEYSSEESVADTVDVGASLKRLVALLGVGAVVFALGVGLAELGGELGNDVDFKPFFLVYLLIALVRFGGPTLALGLGAAMGEGVHDLIEGYEADEPLGFIGFIVGFVVFGWVLHRVAPDPGDRRWQVTAAMVGAFVQALFEGFAFLFMTDFSVGEALYSVAGNTVTHGILLGAIPFALLYPAVADGWWLFSGPSEGNS